MYKVASSEEFDLYFRKLSERASEGDYDSAMLIKLIRKGIEKLKYDVPFEPLEINPPV